MAVDTAEKLGRQQYCLLHSTDNRALQRVPWCQPSKHRSTLRADCGFCGSQDCMFNKCSSAKRHAVLVWAQAHRQATTWNPAIYMCRAVYTFGTRTLPMPLSPNFFASYYNGISSIPSLASRRPARLPLDQSS